MDLHGTAALEAGVRPGGLEDYERDQTCPPPWLRPRPQFGKVPRREKMRSASAASGAPQRSKTSPHEQAIQRR